MTTVRGEAARKSIHVGLSLVAAAVVWLLEPRTAAVVLAAATTVALSIEMLRRASAGFGRRFVRTLSPMLRDREGVRLTGATTLSVGYTLAATLLPGTPALAGILYAGVADAAAAVVGRRWGRRRFPGGKSVEGSLVFFLVAMVIGAALPIPDLDLAMAALAALILMIIEAPTLRVDDNLYLPIAGAAVVLLLTGRWGTEFFS